MIYSTPEFLILFLPTLFLYSIIQNQRARFALLTVVSFFFYCWAGFTDTLIFLTVILFSWAAGWFADRFPTRRKLFIGIGITVMVAHLFFWKYAPWLVGEYQKIRPGFLGGEKLILPLPIGISFFTLQGIAYLVDFQRGKTGLMRLREFVLFKSFFPQLVAGPIVRAHQLLPQLRTLPIPSLNDFLCGASLFVMGFGKKLFLADRLPPLIDGVFASPQKWNRSSLVGAALGYTVQIWADFSGYTDMGRGAARMLGIRLPENFLSPYFSKTPSEFWRRWHITLSEWIRDYLYIPLGGSKGSLLRVALVLLATMVISGLWHGANWTFLCWGIFHGLLLTTERFVPKLFSLVTTQLAVVLGWILFRSETLAHFGAFLHAFCVQPGDQTISILNVAVNLGLCLSIQGLCYCELAAGAQTHFERAYANLCLWMANRPTRAVALGAAWGASMAASVWLSLVFQASGAGRAFIYFQF